MSQEESSIVCRQCSEVIPLEAGNCPHCGKGIRDLVRPIVGILIGGVLTVAALLNLSNLLAFGVLGVLIAVSSGYLIYDRQRRIQQAAERGGHTATEP